MNHLKTSLLTSHKFITQLRNYETHKVKILKHLTKENHLKELIEFIPEKYLSIKRYNSLDALYLIDKYVARNICKHMLPHLWEGNQIIAETGAGLGLVASELLDNNVKKVRLYETCPEFRTGLHDFNNVYPKRVELFSRNLFHMASISTQDKFDRGNRISQMLKNVPKKAWNEGPCMTVFGCMINRGFIHYLLKMLAMQAEIVAYGRIQIFAIMRPSDYVKLTATSDNDLHTYNGSSVLFQNLFQCQLIDKYPRTAFLPWEAAHKTKKAARYSTTVDVDQMYFVKILPKRSMPIPTESILPFYFFVRQFFGRGMNRVVPSIEKFLPGCGRRLIFPSRKYVHYYDDLSIYTRFGQLNPKQILSVFKEMIQHEGYNGSAFEAMIQSELVKYETRETDNSLLIEDSLESLEVEDLEEHFE